jgi:beta-lactamase regulating signal transducer with metallopeptidase domain
MMEQALAEYIVNAVWQVPLLAGGAWLLLRIARPGPQSQHRVWLAVLALCLLLPLRGMDSTGVFAPQLQPAAFVIEEPATSEEPLSQGKPSFESPHYFKRTVRLNASATHWLVRLYLATVAFTLFRLTRAWSASRRLVANAQVTSRHSMTLAHYSQRFQVKPPQVRESEEVSSPMIVGVVAPVLLLPEGFFQRSEDEVRAALCHELAHVHRRDYLMNLLCQVAALPVAWHPVVNQVQQSIRVTREMVCDAMAAQEMKSHIGYARCLLALANSMLGGTGVAPQGMGLFSKNTLEKRVMLLMETTKMTVQARIARSASGAAVMIAAGTLAAMFHVAPTMAEQRAEAPQPAMQAVPAAAQIVPNAAAPAPSPIPVKQTRKRRVARAARIRQRAEQRTEDNQPATPSVRVMLDSPEFQRQMEEVQRQMAKVRVVDSPEFKRRMEDVQRQMANVTVMLDSREFKQQMENVQRETVKVKVMVDSPEFKRQMEEVQRQMANVRVRIEGLTVAPCTPGEKTP